MNRYRKGRSFRRSDRGFALMEVLIAFTIAAMVMGTLVYGVAVAVRSDVRAKANRSEMRLAQSRLEAAGVEQPLRTGWLEGETDGLRWRQRTSKANPIVLLAPAPKSQARPAAELYWVEVAVTGSRGTEVRLATSKVAIITP